MRASASAGAVEPPPESPPQSVHLEETFYVLNKRSAAFRVRLTDKGLSLRREGDGASKERSISARDMVGCRCSRAKSSKRGGACACTALGRKKGAPSADENEGDDTEPESSDVSAYLYVYAYKLKRGVRGGRRERNTLALRFRSFDRFDDNQREALKWRHAVRCLIEGRPVSTAAPPAKDDRRVLVLLNPKSGSGKAREQFQKTVAPLFAEAEVSYDLHVTKKADYAREFVREHNLYRWRGIVAVGGDGIVYEILNGLFERSDWKQVLEELPLGVIPCGSGNGLARTICHIYDEPYDRNPVMASTLAIVRGHTNAMDVIRVETKTQILFSFLSIGWGLLSDIDIESERLRIIGGKRFTVWSLARLIGLRTYRGKVYYSPVSVSNVTSPVKLPSTYLNHSFSQDGIVDCNECFELGDECENCRTNATITLDNSAEEEPKEQRTRLDSWYSTTSKKSAYFSLVGSDYRSIVDDKGLENGKEKTPVQVYGPASRLPALTAPPPNGWKCIEGEFILVHAAYQPFLGEDCIFAPESKLDDGIIWLVIIRGEATRGQLLSFLLGLGSGAHANGASSNNGTLQLIPVNAFRIEPEPDPTHPAHITVDGELVAYGPVQAEVCSVQARIMVPPH